MGLDPFQAQQMIERLERNAGRLRQPEHPGEGVSKEIEELHEPIINWCREQFPMVPYIRARSDQASTIGKGIQDFTIFYKSKVLCIECKSRTGKRTPDQIAWAMLMEKQGFTVHEVRSLKEFFSLVGLP